MPRIPYERHVFVCINERTQEHPRGCCSSKGGLELHARLKALAKEHLGPGASIRINKAGCLDVCEQGCAMVVYPDAVWYGSVTDADLEEIVQSHLINGRPVERLRIDESKQND